MVDIKKALSKQSLFGSKQVVELGGNHVIATRTFFALSDFKRDFLVFIEARIALCLDFRMVDEQIGCSVSVISNALRLRRVRP